MNLVELRDDFVKRFHGDENDIYFFTAPISVTVIGHISSEYGGRALIIPISVKTTLALQRRGDDNIDIQSTNSNVEVCAPLYALKNSDFQDTFKTKLIGKFYNKTNEFNGFNILYNHDIHDKGSVTDDSATGVCTLFALNSLLHTNIPLKELIHMAEKCQDKPSKKQLAKKINSAFSKKGYISCIDSGREKIDYLPFSFPNHSFVITLTQKNPKKTKSKQEFEDGLYCLKQINSSISSSCDISYEDYQKHRNVIDNPKSLKLWDTIMEEELMIENCKTAIENNDMNLFCKTLNETKKINKNCQTILDICKSANGVIESFAMCNNNIISIVSNDYIDDLMHSIKKNVSFDITFYVADTENGVTELNAE